MLPLLKRIRARLVQRIYLVGLVQFVLVAAGIVVLARQNRPPSLFDDTRSFIVATLEAESDSPASLQAALERVNRSLHWSMELYDAKGARIASVGGHRPPPGDRDPSGRQGPPPTASIALHDGTTARLVYALPPPPAAPGLAGIGYAATLVLVVVGVASWLTARSVAGPLARLSAATTAFGAGDLSVRVAMNRSDELGDVANAFDEMAARVTSSIRAERELLANVSHELRTPLQRIRIALDLANEGDAAMARESLGEIAEDLGELERIVADVLTTTRLALQDGAGKASAVPPIRSEPVDLPALLDKATARLRSAHPERPVRASITGDLPIVMADPVLLRRVIDNLLENAHKYTDDVTQPITLEAKLAAPSLAIEVRDRGIGIAPADLARVFEPFFRADRSRARSTGGLGLGLALAKRIVVAHGGTLTLTSEVGRGTTARIELPLERASRVP